MSANPGIENSSQYGELMRGVAVSFKRMKAKKTKSVAKKKRVAPNKGKVAYKTYA